VAWVQVPHVTPYVLKTDGQRTAFLCVVVGSIPAQDACHDSSVGQSARLLTEWPGVQIPLVTPLVLLRLSW
jgi:hypothetical protein